MRRTEIAGYRWENSELTCAHDYPLPVVMGEMARPQAAVPQRRVFELGCGNGSVANRYAGGPGCDRRGSFYRRDRGSECTLP